MTVESFDEIYFTARDGLRLYGRHYRAQGSKLRPVLCLAGLTRNSRDFHDLARALSAPGPAARDVYTMDYRGRGSSEFDRDWRNYVLAVEANDVLDFMTVTGLDKPSIVGTSRGGLVTMVMAAMQPSRLGPVVMNDIGPVIDAKGLSRIAGYVGKMPLPPTWDAATQLVRDMSKKPFPAVEEHQWAEYARQLFNEKNGRPAPGYDPKLSRAMSVLNGPMPEFWPQFEALRHVPVMVIRGETSDLLSDATVTAMQKRHPDVMALTVPGQGHAPLLKDAPTNNAIAAFFARLDR